MSFEDSPSPTYQAPTRQRARPTPERHERARAKIGPGGRLVIPAAFREAAGMAEGDEVMIYFVDGGLRLITPRAAMEWARARVMAAIPPTVSLVDDLIAERRAEGAND